MLRTLRILAQQGCYNDRYERIPAMLNFKGSGCNPQTCVQHCSIQGSLYAGLKAGGQCFCDKSYWAGGQTEMECNTLCKSRNKSLPWSSRAGYCGGSSALSVYSVSTGLPFHPRAPPPPATSAIAFQIQIGLTPTTKQPVPVQG